VGAGADAACTNAAPPEAAGVEDAWAGAAPVPSAGAEVWKLNAGTEVPVVVAALLAGVPKERAGVTGSAPEVTAEASGLLAAGAAPNENVIPPAALLAAPTPKPPAEAAAKLGVVATAEAEAAALPEAAKPKVGAPPEDVGAVVLKLNAGTLDPRDGVVAAPKANAGALGVGVVLDNAPKAGVLVEEGVVEASKKLPVAALLAPKLNAG